MNVLRHFFMLPPPPLAGGPKPGGLPIRTKIQTNSYLAVSRLFTKLALLQIRIILCRSKRQNFPSLVIFTFQVASLTNIISFLYRPTNVAYRMS